MKRPLQVLIAEDSPADAELVLRELRRAQFLPEWERVDSEADFRARLRPGLDVILSDFAMPQFTGLRALEVLRETGLDIPFILISGTIGEDTAVAAMQHGASDYLLKDRLARLGQAIERALEQAAIRREQRQVETALRASEERFRESARTQIAILNALPAHIALLDAQGVILAVNEAWRRFASAQVPQGPDSSVGSNYLEVCARAYGDCADEAQDAAAGIRRVLTGEAPDFHFEYPCHSPTEQRWFRLMVTPLVERFGKGAVVTHINITDQRLAQKALRMQADMLDHIGQAVTATTTDGRIIYANRAAHELYGWSSAEIIGRNILEVTTPQFSPEQAAAIMAGLQPGTSWSGEFLVQHREGRIFPAHVTASPLLDEAGQMIGIIGISADITARKQAEEALQKSEREQRELAVELRAERARLVAAQAVAKVGSWETDLATLATTWSEETYRIFARQPGEFLPSHPAFLEIVHPEDRAAVDAAFWQSAQGTGPFGIEHRLAEREGRTPFVEERWEIFRGADGRPERAVGTCQDITERKRTEARFRRLVDSDVQGVMFWKMNGEIVGANDAFLEIAGYSRADLEAGRINWTTMTPPEYADRDRRALEELATRGVCTPFEKENLRPDGTRVPVLIGAATFEDNPQEGVTFVLDLSQRKKLEQEFRRAQRMESIGTLAGGIAHDLNNILSPIMMAAPILRHNISTAQRDEIVTTIQMSAERGAQIVKQVLTFGLGLDGERRPLLMGDLIDEMMKIMRGTFPKNILVEVSIEPGLWPLLGDATQLHQVLLNLCVNARDAMPKGGRLRLSAANRQLDTGFAGMVPEASPGPHVVLEVSDTGTGIPREIVERIFDPFFTTKGVGQGSGLGLSTSLGIVKSHGGFFQVKSSAGQGTTFTVSLPAAPHHETTLADAAQETVPAGQGELILVVDDEQQISAVVSLILKTAGYRVSVAASGADALATFAADPGAFAAVLTDLMMPVMDGVALIRALRSWAPVLPIIAATGLGEKARLAELKAMHIETILHKPFTGEILLRALHEALHPPPPQP